MSSRSGAAAGSDSASSTPMHTLTKIKKEQWVSDDMATSCYGCGADFTITTRKHHCRLCGNCFCNSCSSKRLSHRRKKSDAEEEDDGGANGSNENARGRSDEVSARKKTSIFAKTWKKGISALTGDVKQIRVCDSCYETERILASTGGAAPADAIHLESSDEEGGDKSSSTRAPKSTTSPGGSTTASSGGLASGAHPPRLMKAPTRRGGLPGLGDGESDEEGDSSSGKPGSDALRGKLERSNRKVRLTKEEEAAAATAGGAATSPSAAATASAVHPASPLPVHSPIHCLFARHFRVGAREKIKLLIPDPVLLYFGNKKHVNDLTGLGDGGVFGSAAAHHSSHSSSHSNTAQHSGPAAIWNHLRSVIHGHACEHAKENHSPSTPQDQHFDCQVPHITKCAETFPFRYGALAITNYQIIWLPMLLPPHVNAKGASAIQNNYKASTYCTSCSNATETPHSPSSSSAAITTSTCCSSCGCMPLVNSWEHIANNSVAYRTQHASVPSHNNSSSDYLSSHIVPHSHPSQCDTCVPIMPICIPLLSVGRFRLRTFEKADLGLLEVRSKTFVHLRLLFPGLISRNRFGHFRNIAICIDYFSKIRPEGHQHAISTSGDTESGWGSSKKDTGGSSKDNEEGSTSGHEVINESEVSGLKKIAFAWKWDSDCDTLRDLPPLSESPTAAEEERGLIRLHGVDARRTTRTNRRRETASLAPPQQVEDANASAFVGSEELLSEDESDSESTASSTTSNNNATAPVAPIPQSTSSTTMTLNSTTTQSQAEEDKRVQLQRSLSKASISSGFIPASLAIPPKQTTAAAAVGWHVYDPISEYTRLGLFAPTSHYRMSSLNAQFRFSPTYPKVLIVPKGVSEKELEGIAPFRSKARIPCVVWSRTNYSEAQIAAQAVSTMGSLNGSGNYSQLQSQSQTQSTSISNMSRVVPNAQTVMLRSAQPMVGITRTRNHNDELFMQWVVANSPSNKRFIIADARPLANAMAQQALGKGYELTENYQSHIIRDIQIQFMDIGNIHVMRTSEEALSKLCQHYQESLYINATGALSHVSELCVNKRYCNQNNTHVPQFHSCGSSSNTEPATPATPASPLSVGLCPHACSCTCCFTNVGSHGLPTDFNAWWSGLLATGHFEHLTAILRAANFIVQTIQSGTSCLVHCSDGWDRTSQLTSLSQLALDPYYRTLHGFFVLICKEWLSFGHKFTERLGHGGIGGRENSPVFTQWLDCVYQYLHQFPTRFEFNADLLLALRHSLHSGKYGTWFANSESERAAAASSNSASSPASNNSSTAAHASGSLWKLMDKTPSIFSQLWFYRHRFLNAQYEYSPSSSDGQPFLDAQSEYARNRPLLLDLHGITFWKEFYLPGICIKQDVLKPSEATVMAATSAAEKQGAATSAVQAEEAKQLREAVEKQKRLIQEQEDKLTRALEELAAMKRAAAAAAATPPAVATVAAATTPDPTPAPAVQPEEEREAVVCTPSPETVVEDAAADDSVSALVSMTDPVISETTTVIGQDLIPAPPTSQPMTRDAAVSDPAPRHSLASASEASSSSSNAAADLESTLPATVEEEEDQFDESGLLKHTRPRAVRNTGSLISPAALAKAAAEANADGLNGDEEPLSPPAGSHPLLDPALVATRQSRQRSRSSILPSEVAKQQAAAQNRLLGGPPSQHNSNPSTPASNFTSASNPNAGPPLPSFRPTSPLRRALSPVGNQPGGVPANTSTGGGSMRDAKSMWGVILRRQGPSLPQKLRAAAHTVVQSSPPASAVATTTATAGTGGTASVAAPASPAHATAANGTVASTPPLTPTHSITAAESTVSTIPSTPPPASATFAAPPSISTTPVSHASERRDSELGPPTPPFPNQLLNSRTKSIELAPVNEHDIARAPSTPSSSTTSSSTFTPSSASSSIALPRSASNPHVTPSTSMQASDRRVDHAAVVFSSSDESEGEDNAENRRGSMVTSQSSGNNNHYHSSKGVEWKDDDSTAACSLCREVFTFFNRRHHCRRCGDVYCNSCCPKLNLDSNLIPGMMALGAMGHNNDLDQQTPQKKKKTKTRLCLACKKENKVHINSPAPTTEEQQQ